MVHDKSVFKDYHSQIMSVYNLNSQANEGILWSWRTISAIHLLYGFNIDI